MGRFVGIRRMVWGIQGWASEEGMVAQEGKEFPGHVRGESLDEARLHDHPLAVGAREHEEGLACEGAIGGEGAKNLSLLPAHHIGLCTILNDPGHEVQRAEGRLEDAHAGGKAAWVSRAGCVGNFAPASAAADHSRGNHGKGRLWGYPVGEGFRQGAVEVTVYEVEDSPGALARFKDDASRREAVGAEGGGTPVDTDELGVEGSSHGGVEGRGAVGGRLRLWGG
ncbi:MAG: hypothetical protein RLZZ142_2908 [Verrucomicrobiota bacterium]